MNALLTGLIILGAAAIVLGVILKFSGYIIVKDSKEVPTPGGGSGKATDSDKEPKDN